MCPGLQANDRLKAWLHRRRFHKSGRIPLLEAEAAQLRQTVAQTAALRQDLAQQQARAATLRRQADHWDKRLSAETDKFQTVSQQRYAQAAAELDAAQLHLRPSRPSSRPRSSRWTGRPRRSPRRSTDHRRALSRPPVADDGLRHLVVLLTVAGRPCISSPGCRGFPWTFRKSPCSSWPWGRGSCGCWCCSSPW